MRDFPGVGGVWETTRQWTQGPVVSFMHNTPSLLHRLYLLTPVTFELK